MGKQLKTVVGIDLGTQSSKVIFYDYEAGQIAASASAPHKLLSADDGSSEQEASWWVKGHTGGLWPDLRRPAGIRCGGGGFWSTAWFCPPGFRRHCDLSGEALERHLHP